MNRIIFCLSLRNIVKNKQSVLINMIGLILSLTCCFVIYYKIRYEYSFDKFHTDYETTYRIFRQTKGLGLNLPKGEWEYNVGVFGGLPDEIEREIPQIKKITTVFSVDNFIVEVPDITNEDKTVKYKYSDLASFTKPSYFDIFDFKDTDFKWLLGSPDKSLSKPFSVVLTESDAQKYFGTSNALGYTFNIYGNKFTVTGIVSDIPKNSDLPFKMFLSFNSLETIYRGLTNDWGSLTGRHQCYLVLNSTEEKEFIESRIKDVYAAHCSKEESECRLFKLQPLSDVHKDDRFGNFNNRTASNKSIFILGMIGILLLIMACVNYSNLALLKSRSKSNEVGIRKILGSTRTQIVKQYFVESLGITVLSVIIALFLSFKIISFFPTLFFIPDIKLIPTDYITIVTYLSTIILVSFTSFGYPAILISAYKPIELMKNKLKLAKTGGIGFTQSMTVLQFAISIVMIISTITIFIQYRFMTKSDLGFNRDAIFTVEVPTNNPSKVEWFKTELLSNPSIKSVSFSSSSPANSGGWSDIVKQDNNDETRIVSQFVQVDTAYFKTYSLKLVAGSNFKTSNNECIINEELCKQLGYANPEDAIGETVGIYGNANDQRIITGVVKNYHYSSLFEKIRPTTLLLSSQPTYLAGIKLLKDHNNPDLYFSNLNSTLKFVENTWKSAFSTDAIYDYEFLDDRVEGYYKSEASLSSLISIFTLATIIITCLGIWGLTIFINELRIKEIGIRKVNGAKVSEVMIMLNQNFAQWIIIAFIIASPIAYYAMQKWLENFAYKTELSWWIFVLAGVMALGIALLTVSWQSWRTATRNPVEALRYE